MSDLKGVIRGFVCLKRDELPVSIEKTLVGGSVNVLLQNKEVVR